MQTLLDSDDHLTAYVKLQKVKQPTTKGEYDISLLNRSVIVADRFYNDFSLLNVLGSNQVCFMVRLEESLKFKRFRITKKKQISRGLKR